MVVKITYHTFEQLSFVSYVHNALVFSDLDLKGIRSVAVCVHGTFGQFGFVGNLVKTYIFPLILVHMRWVLTHYKMGQ